MASNHTTYRKIAEYIEVNRGVIQRLLTKYKQERANEDIIILPVDHNSDVKTIEGKKYRRFRNTNQDLVCHYLLDLKGFDKVLIDGSKWYYEIKPHRCHIHCVDSQDTTTPLGYYWEQTIH